MTTEQLLREALARVLFYLEDGANHGDEAAELLPIVKSALSHPAAAANGAHIESQE